MKKYLIVLLFIAKHTVAGARADNAFVGLVYQP